MAIQVLAPAAVAAQDEEIVRLSADTLIQLTERQYLLKMVLQIKEGLHIQSHQPENDWVIPTRITLEGPLQLSFGEIIFPPARSLQLEAGADTLQVFKGQLEILVPLLMKEADTGNYELIAKIHFQACNRLKCFFPRNTIFKLNVNM